MAAAVDELLEEGGLLVCEAGTGTGKTFAYLVPILLHAAGKVIVSTGTKALQDQLFHRDLPVAKDILASSARGALLKGRSNYLCLHRLEQAEHARDARDPRAAARLHAVRGWSSRTESGEVSEVLGTSLGDPLHHQITSNIDNCLGQECAFFSECFVMKARRAAQEADVLVINHHLLFSDILLREEGFGELLPGAQAFVIDEAHQLPELASRFFGMAISARQLFDLGRDTLRSAQLLSGEFPGVERAVRGLERAVEGVCVALGARSRVAAWEEGTADRPLDELHSELTGLRDLLRGVAERDKALANCLQRCESLDIRLSGFSTAGHGEAPAGERVRWFESGSRSFVLHATPMDFADIFRRSIDRYQSSWLFTSATLAVGGSFRHFTGRLGIDDARTARWDSPFDFEANALLYLPEDLPEPNSPAHTAAVVETAKAVIAAANGGVFVLFTSHQAMQEAARLLSIAPVERPVFVQGTAPHNELLEEFRRAGNGVLIATASFWEGVDVRGPALSCVIIDKLPFAQPDDPVLQARGALLRERGGNPFRDYQLPAAVVALKQGIGRLIRDANDRGVLVICDPRLSTRSYGRVFLDNVPPMPRTHALADVIRFFSPSHASADAAMAVTGSRS
jgi:ATP-dependent DNA helicase DinG